MQTGRDGGSVAQAAYFSFQAIKAKMASAPKSPVKAQIFGKKSCPWSGRAITLMEKHKVDFDWVDLEEPEHEAKLAPLMVETNQQTVPFVYLRGKFVGGKTAIGMDNAS